MIVLRHPDGSYLQHATHGNMRWTHSILDARQFENIEAYNKDTYGWEREELSLLTVEVVTILGYWSQPKRDYEQEAKVLLRERQALSAMKPEDNRSASQRMKEERQRIQFEDRGYYNL